MDRDHDLPSLPVRVRPYPVRDRAFAVEVSEAIESVAADLALDDELAELVEARLRHTYPNAVVRVQQPLAKLLDPVGTVYAYRDGRIRPEDLRRERLYQALSDARETHRDSDRIIHDSQDIAGHWLRPRMPAGSGPRPADGDTTSEPEPPDAR